MSENKGGYEGGPIPLGWVPEKGYPESSGYIEMPIEHMPLLKDLAVLLDDDQVSRELIARLIVIERVGTNTIEDTWLDDVAHKLRSFAKWVRGV